MDETVKHVKAIGRFGTRYGRRNRIKVAMIESQHKRKHKCPKCNYIAVRRKSVGIWYCEKCNTKFTSKAYTVSKPQAIKSSESR